MIDTIVLTLSRDMFSIDDVDKFTPSARWVIQNSSWVARGIRSKQNPTKKEIRDGIYKPHLTLFHRTNFRGKQDIILKIELSLPKLFLAQPPSTDVACYGRRANTQQD